ncbi:MAG: DUF5615 family PIN-like protein [Gammaproteobacteria bacterium]
MQRLLADENVPMTAVRLLRARGFDVAAVAEDCPGASDLEVLRLACGQRRWLITFDRDYGALIFQGRQAAPPGVLYLRVFPSDPAEPGHMVEDALHRFGREGMFLVVGREGTVRERPLPVVSDGSPGQ